MKHKVITLTDGSKLEVNVNFATLYYMHKIKISKLLDKEKLTEDQEVELAGRLVFVILRSNGKKVDMDEAMILAPMDTDEIGDLFEEFSDRIEDYKKKQDAKAMMGKNLK